MIRESGEEPDSFVFRCNKTGFVLNLSGRVDLFLTQEVSMIPSERMDRAFAMARELHKDQKRKNIPTPFLSHPMTVASLVLENSDDEDLVIIALLHDVVEDAGGLPTLERVREQFGDRIADGVNWLSDSSESPRPPKRERNLAYMQKMLDAPEELVVVSCCDKIANLRSMAADYLILGDAIWSAYSLPPEETVANYQNLLKIYKQRLGNHRVVMLLVQALTTVCEIYNKFVENNKSKGKS